MKKLNILREKDWLIQSAVGELHFANLRIEHLLWVLDEIESITDSNLIKILIKNEKERDNLDKLIHTELLFK